MKYNRTANSLRNSVSGMINKWITLLLPFFIRTVIINILGAEYLGLSSLFTSILQVLNLSELGFSSAVVSSMYKPIAENDSDTICALMNLYKKVYRIIGCVILIAGLLVMPFLPKLIKGSWPSDINIYLLYIIYLFNTAISYFLFAYKTCLLTAHQRNDISNNVGTCVSIAQYTVQIVLLLVFKNYYLYILVHPVMVIVTNLVNAHYASKLFPKYVCRGELSQVQSEDIKKKVAGLLISKIGIVSRNSMDSIFLSAFFGLTTVAMYGNYYYIMGSVQGFLGVLIISIQAGIGNSVASETVEKNYHDIKKFLFMYMWLAGWCTVCLFCLYQPFMYIWVGEKLTFPFSVMVLFCMYFYTLCQGDVCGAYSNAVGYWWKVKQKYIVETVLNLVLNFTLVILWGVHGIIVATMLSILIVSYSMGIPYLYKFYFKGISMIPMYLMQAAYAGATIINCAVTYFICSLLPLGIQWFFVRVIICMIVPNVLYVLFYFRTEFFKEMLDLLSRIIHGKGRR